MACQCASYGQQGRNYKNLLGLHRKRQSREGGRSHARRVPISRNSGLHSLSKGTPDVGNDNIGPLFLAPASSLPTFNQAHKSSPPLPDLPIPPPPPPKQVCPPQPPAAAQVHCCHPPGRRQRTGRARAAPAHQGMEKLIKGSIRSGANGAHHSCVCI